MGRTVAETIQHLTRTHLESGKGLLLGQCVTAVGWIGGTVPDCKGIVEIPMTDVAGSAFAVGVALMGKRPIFVVRYQGFMWYNASSLVNYAARSKSVWGVPVPIFIRSIAMEGNGIGHTASSSLHSLFMHAPGMPVVAPMTPKEYEAAWNYFMKNDDPLYVSEHRRSFSIDYEMKDEVRSNARVTLIAISAARLNAIEARERLREMGVAADMFHVVWLKPFEPVPLLLESLSKTRLGLVIDSDFELSGASQSFAYELMHRTHAKVYALGLADRVCGVARMLENITPSQHEIVERVRRCLNA